MFPRGLFLLYVKAQSYFWQFTDNSVRPLFFKEHSFTWNATTSSGSHKRQSLDFVLPESRIERIELEWYSCNHCIKVSESCIIGVHFYFVFRSDLNAIIPAVLITNQPSTTLYFIKHLHSVPWLSYSCSVYVSDAPVKGLVHIIVRTEFGIHTMMLRWFKSMRSRVTLAGLESVSRYVESVQLRVGLRLVVGLQLAWAVCVVCRNCVVK